MHNTHQPHTDHVERATWRDSSGSTARGMPAIDQPRLVDWPVPVGTRRQLSAASECDAVVCLRGMHHVWRRGQDSQPVTTPTWAAQACDRWKNVRRVAWGVGSWSEKFRPVERHLDHAGFALLPVACPNKPFGCRSTNRKH